MTDKTSILKRIADLKSQGMSYQAIADQLRSEGLADFSPATIRRYLKEVQSEQTSVASPSADIQEVPIDTIENVRDTDIKVQDEKNLEALSNPEKIVKRQGITYSEMYRREHNHRREVNWLTMGYLFIAALLIISVILIVLIIFLK
ncbi:MAG: hypothetical protein QW292_05225 [Candidatus Parvarchaeota archaeon]